MLQKISLIFGTFLYLTLSTVQAESIPDPCKLLTHQEIEKIIGIPMKSGQLEDDRNTFLGMTCQYGSVSRFEKSGNIDITIDTTQSMKETDSIYESAKDLYDRSKYAHMQALKRKQKEDTFHKVKNLGDDAYWNHNSLKMLYKNIYIEIRVFAGAGIIGHNSKEVENRVDAINLSLSKKIAHLVFERLKLKEQSKSLLKN